MRKWTFFLIALCMAAALSACSGIPSGDSSSADPGGRAGSGASLTATDESALYEAYTDVSALPVFEIDMDEVRVFDDRTLTLEGLIRNEPELLTYNLAYYIASAQFDLLMELVGEEESIQIAMGNEASNFEAGYYCTETTIHGLSTLTAEDLDRVSSFEQESVLRLIRTFDFEEYVVVETEESWKYNEAYAAAGPQLDDGERYTRYYLFAKTAGVPEFRLYGVYWEDFLTA